VLRVVTVRVGQVLDDFSKPRSRRAGVARSQFRLELCVRRAAIKGKASY